MRTSKVLVIAVVAGVVLVVLSLFRRQQTLSNYQYGSGNQVPLGNTGNNTVNGILAGINGVVGIFNNLWKTTDGFGSNNSGGVNYVDVNGIPADTYADNSDGHSNPDMNWDIMA